MHLQEALELVEKENVAINVIAKDFNTLEPGISFRLLRDALKKKYGSAYHQRVFVTGSRGSGQLFDLAQLHGYHFLDFPENFGGRFSVLSAVGLLPMAVAGIDLYKIFHGAKAAESYLKSTEPEKNQGVIYAVTRNLLFQKGFTLESLVLFEPDLLHLGRWWVQLFAESEGKTENAIFPVSFMYSDDLHAVGQYVQEGRRCIAETYLRLFHPNKPLVIPESPEVSDGFDYLSHKEFQTLNETVYQAALEAHKNDGIPCTQFIAESTICPEIIGYFFYYSFFVCYLSCVLLEVNPFDQEGVEGYKRNMYALLGKYQRER
jgi:glucose-6-phosphate isomerase